MVNWEKLFEVYQLDYSLLNEFKPKGEIDLFRDKDSFIAAESWCSDYKLGCHLLPVFTNNESDFVGIYTDSILAGKVVCVNHNNIDFAPQFRSLKSFIDKVNEHPIRSDWHNLPVSSYDYPPRKPQTEAQQADDEAILTQCWVLMAKNHFLSTDHYALVAETILVLTPPTQVETIMRFLDDKDVLVQHKAIQIIGVFHQYQPAKEKIRQLAENPLNKRLCLQCYNGNLYDKKPNFWRRLFGK